MRTILVGSDLTERSYPAIVRGAELARRHGGRLVVCHAGIPRIGVHPLFPQRHQEDLTSSADIERRIGDELTRSVTELTGLDTFDVVVDMGDAPTVLCAQATRVGADLVVVMVDSGEKGRTVARDLTTSPCSVLSLGQSAGDAVALVTLESELDSLPRLVAAAQSVALSPPRRVVAILWADSEKKKGPLLARLEQIGKQAGTAFEPWFASWGDASVLARVATEPDIGLVALGAPVPDKLAGDKAGPFDDALPAGTASLLLVRW